MWCCKWSRLLPWNFYETFISKLLKLFWWNNNHETHHNIQQNALRYGSIRLCCDITDVNNTENSSQECWQHDLRLQQSYPSQSYPVVTLLCVEQDWRRVLFLTEQKISRSKNNTVIPRYWTGSNIYLQVEIKSGVRLECSIEMNKGNLFLWKHEGSLQCTWNIFSDKRDQFHKLSGLSAIVKIWILVAH